MTYAPTADIRRQISQIVRPPVRTKVSEAAEKYVRVGVGGNNSKPWEASATPYMIEPMDCLNERRYTTVCFVGPARTGKTQGLLDCWIGYVVKCAPGDMMIVHTSQDAARDYSRRRVDRLFRHSPELVGEISTYGHADNTFDKTMKNGMMLSIGWPTIRQLSSRDIKYMAVTDYDRGPEDIDGEGDKYTLAQKRTETFLSSGMTLVESSPGNEWSNSKWTPQTLHELPPSAGIVMIYNRGDRRRYYWQCLDCNEWFIPSFDLLHWSTFSDPADAAKTVSLGCPHCGSMFEHKTKREFNLKGVWLREGQTINADGEIFGDGRESRIASFHMSGVMAAFQTWESLAFKWLTANKEFESSGDDTTLRATVLADQGVPYKPKSLRPSRNASDLQERAEVWNKYSVPAGVRFLMASVDVQKNRFVVQVIGYGVEKERWLIDRYNISQSSRDGQAVDPGAYIEDWDLLLPLMDKRYELADGSGRWLQVYLSCCDSGGAEGVASNAYAFWRKYRKKRFFLVKGDGKYSAKRIDIRYPDTSSRKDRGASKGDVPVMFIGTNMIKDALDNDLRRNEPGPGYFHAPDWIGGWWHDELTKEERGPKGWLARSGNEAWDLLVYTEALAIHAGIEKIKWDTPPVWAAPFDKNALIFEERKNPGTPIVARPSTQRRVIKSQYLGN